MNLFKLIGAYQIRLKRNISGTYGMIDKLRGNEIRGWILPPKAGQKIKLHLYINHKYCGQAILPDKKTNEPAAGRLVFSFLPNKALLPGDHVSVKSGVLKAELLNSPRVIPMNNSYASTLEHFASIGNRKESLFFLHIPKTAGTSLWKVLRKNFPCGSALPDRAAIIASGGYPHFHYPLEQHEKVIRECRFLFGHYPYVFKYLLGEQTKVITFLRDPVKRVISQLIHHKTKEKEYRNWSLEDIYEKRIRKNSNLQVRYLCIDTITNKLHPNLLGEVGEAELDRACHNIRNFFFVGITERFDESVHLLEAKLDKKLGKMKKRNVSRKNPDIPSDLLHKIESDNRFDKKLYEFGLALFLIDKRNFGLQPI